MINIFECLSEKELKASKKFEREQRAKDPKEPKDNGRFSYIFTSVGGVGINVVVKDNLLKEEKDITDISCW